MALSVTVQSTGVSFFRSKHLLFLSEIKQANDAQPPTPLNRKSLNRRFSKYGPSAPRLRPHVAVFSL